MKKIVASALLSIVILSSCGKSVEAPVVPEKIAFPVQTKTISDFPNTYTINKTGRMVGSSNISLASQWVGRVSAILVKEGAIVKKGQLLVQLKDTTANYDLKLSQANNSLANAKNNTESTRISLEKAINDTKLALDRAENDLRATESTASKNLEKAVRDSNKSNLTNTSDARVTLDQLQASLDKAKLDRENLIIANQQTIANYSPTYENLTNDLKKFYTKILFEEDRKYGFTPKFQWETATIRSYFGARLAGTRSAAEIAYSELEKAGTELSGLPVQVSEANILPELDRLSRIAEVARSYFDVSGKYLENSITSSTFTQTQLDGYIALNNGYKTELSALESGETSFRNTVATFLANYKNNESSAASALIVQEKNIEVQKRQLETTSFDSTLSLDKLKTSNDQIITTGKISVESAKIAYENAKENKAVTLKKLSLAEADAALGIAQAQEEFGKLSILAPIDGSITRVIASVGQEVSAGTPVIELANKNPEITFDAEASIVPLLKVGSSQSVKYQGSYYTGTISGVSQVATDSLLYTARIVLPDNSLLLGQVASIELHLPSDYPVLPSDIIKVISDKKWELQTLSGGMIVPLEVDLGRIAGDRVEITSKVSPDIQIIISNVLNFDAKKSKIVIENPKK